ncbi:guanylate kinase [Ceratitis capitata]|uniref:guanylate kinase n=1 Tax=Ceratitis capitata TaxID=7213 RepID=W8C0H2_CERCA|nr:guanylate kinase [Ceratitis capitata]XP_004524893.1 guanylate kinase [Ceratitis capitata]XP_004524894.1 guanylate kinase [Ceratitis capitata]XP_004524895.1 guanylate kinase [Ceratitis capitata]XP_004524896.1 guanylate kinase [Ceratitis capitata]XP_020714298.1 guanylate kinase [Ceratitis capitata]
MLNALKTIGKKELTQQLCTKMSEPSLPTSVVTNYPRPLVLCGPSGSGKSTLLKRLFGEYPQTFGFSVSHTTRQPRQFEVDGEHYHFIEKQAMEEKIANGEFIETATFCGNLYGTSKAAVRDVQKENKVCVLDIEPQGVEQIKKTDLNPLLVFNNPPSIEELERRLRKRQSETEESLKKRLTAAEGEIAYGLKEGNFQKIIHNIDIDVAYAEFKEFVLNELKLQEAAGVKIRWE